MEKLLARLRKIYPDKYIKVEKGVSEYGVHFSCYFADLGWVGITEVIKSLKELEVVLKAKGWLND